MREPPIRALLAPKMTTALEVAVLVKCLPDIKMAAELIEDYARSAGAAARLDATLAANERAHVVTRRAIEAPLAAAPAEYEATLDQVREEMR